MHRRFAVSARVSGAPPSLGRAVERRDEIADHEFVESALRLGFEEAGTPARKSVAAGIRLKDPFERSLLHIR